MSSTLKIGFSAISLLGLVVSCQDKHIEEITYTANVPIYSTTQDLNALIGSDQPHELNKPGKIHINGHRLYIVDQFKGVHVFDNADPYNPINMAYIAIPGIIDIASKGNVLYADSYDDLLTLDVSDLTNVTVLDRDNDVFVQVLPPTDNEYPIAEIDPDKGVVVAWKVEQITEKHEVDQWGNGWGFGAQEDLTTFNNTSTGGSTLSSPSQNTGISGSMARFTATPYALYALNDSELQTFDLSNASNPSFTNRVNTNRVVETIFPLDDKLFIGTTTGMAVYSIESPHNPSFISDFNHVTSCDPVVVENDVAYVTLRTGSNCGGWVNQLDVLDVSDIENPNLISSYEMSNPHGLGIDDELLFICDGQAGLKVYNVMDKMAIDQNQIAHFPNIQAYDVIPLQNILLMIGEDGFYQYDYSDLTNIHVISQIQVQ